METQIIYENIAGLFNLAVVSAFILIGIFLISFDTQRLLKKKLKRESIFAKILGFIYIIGSIAAYTVFQIV
ncbi:CLC_0170 family protein [Serpentinicella sp. ANB-PHB4]|uniref:CLC_0170 family protein n=1 Tax=Serpentinicella sp. ANB-PHB4 TaxID=3074076 RepID=UPI0028548A52|nr:CLC_0170 family protein [Serpentinicella sp. ANB-PHB4]MDR5659134.1 CLC_0170 family protein [Serpentinicella sp. ANB-PHB4]